jgi:hypothetical protein
MRLRMRLLKNKTSGSQEDLPSALGVLSETTQWMIPRPSCLRILSGSRSRHAIVPRACAHHPPSYQPFQARGSQGFCKSSGPPGAQTAAVFDPDDHASGRARNGISRSAEYPRMQTMPYLGSDTAIWITCGLSCVPTRCHDSARSRGGQDNPK